MRILWTHNFSPSVANAENFMHGFYNRMRDFGITVDLLYLGNLRNMWALIEARRKVSNLSLKYDIVHSQFGSACAWASSAAQAKKILSLRGSDWHKYSGYNQFMNIHAKLSHSFTRFSINRFDRILTMSRRMSAEVQEFVGAERVITFPDPIDLDSFILRDKIECRKAMFCSNDISPWVLFTSISEHNPIKRIELSRSAFEFAAQHIPELKFKVASKIPTSDMPYFVSSCDVILCTSVHEGWPNSVKEALACGIPFVSTDVSDLFEIAQRNSSCFVCEPSAERLAERVIKCLSSPSDSAALRSEVVDMNLDDSCIRLKAIYEDVLNH